MTLPEINARLSRMYGEDIAQETMVKYLESPTPILDTEHWCQHVGHNLAVSQYRWLLRRKGYTSLTVFPEEARFLMRPSEQDTLAQLSEAVDRIGIPTFEKLITGDCKPASLYQIQKIRGTGTPGKRQRKRLHKRLTNTKNGLAGVDTPSVV